jgi:hypothetical protein
LFKFYSHSKTTTKTNFILDEIKRSISIFVYYGWKRSIKNGRRREIDRNIIFLLQISYSPHSGTNKIKWDMCSCILNIIVNYYFGNHFPYFTCDDVTLVNEKSIVSWKYMKSNKKCVFNVNFQYNHKQVPTAYFTMMFNMHSFWDWAKIYPYHTHSFQFFN